MSNPVLAYMRANNLKTGELATALGVTKGYASLLKDGERPISIRVARRLGELTGKSWTKFVSERARVA